jgi:hypothetical protein
MHTERAITSRQPCLHKAEHLHSVLLHTGCRQQALPPTTCTCASCDPYRCQAIQMPGHTDARPYACTIKLRPQCNRTSHVNHKALDPNGTTVAMHHHTSATRMPVARLAGAPPHPSAARPLLQSLPGCCTTACTGTSRGATASGPLTSTGTTASTCSSAPHGSLTAPPPLASSRCRHTRTT